MDTNKSPALIPCTPMTPLCFVTDFSLILTNSCQHDQISPLRGLRGVCAVLKHGNSRWRESKFTRKFGRRGGWGLPPLLDQHLRSGGQRLPLTLGRPRGAPPSKNTPNPAGGRQSPPWREAPDRAPASSAKHLKPEVPAGSGGRAAPQGGRFQRLPAALPSASASAGGPEGRERPHLSPPQHPGGTAAPHRPLRTGQSCPPVPTPVPSPEPGAAAAAEDAPRGGEGKGRAAPGGGTALPPAPRRRRRRRGSR